MSIARRMLLVVACLSAGPAFGQARLGLNFPGISNDDEIALGIDIAPPDTTGAVGPNHFVQFLNGGFGIWDKHTGQLARPLITDRAFWAGLGLDWQPGVADPRIVYDKPSGRWLAVQMTREPAGNRLLLARSNTSDPTQGFVATAFVGNPATGFKVDFPLLGVDADGVYITTNNYDTANNLKGVSIFSIPKADVLGPAISLDRMTRFENLDYNLRGFSVNPVVDYGPSKGHGTLVAVAAEFGKIDRTNILGPADAAATLSPTVRITAQDETWPPRALQPDGSQVLPGGDDNYGSTSYQVAGLLWLTHGTKENNRAAIRWTVLDESTHAIVREGTLADPGYDLIYPSIAANELGDVVIGFTRSGASADSFPSAFAAVGHTAGGITTFETPMLLRAGVASYRKYGGLERWGDYSATAVDPDNPLIFWTTQEYAAGDKRWGTQITQIIVPEPCAWMALLMAAAAWGLRRRTSSGERTGPSGPRP